MLENHHKTIIEKIFDEEIDNFIKKMSSKSFEKNNFIMNNLNEKFKIYSSLARSFDSTLGNTFQRIAQKIAQYMYTGKYKNLKYGGIYKAFKNFDDPHKDNIIFQFYPDESIQKGEIYSNHCDCSVIPYQKNKFHYLTDISYIFSSYSISTGVIFPEKGADLVINLNNRYYIIEIKLGGNLDNKKLESEYNALKKYQEEYYPHNDVSLCLGTVYIEEEVKNKLSLHFKNNFYEPNHYLLLEEDFWNFICGNHENGYSVIKEIYLKNTNKINAFLEGYLENK